MKITDKAYKPFAIGRDWAEWDEKNCGSCKKGFDMKRGKFMCEYQRKLTAAQIVPMWPISEEVAKAIGYLDNVGCSIWECPAWERR